MNQQSSFGAFSNLATGAFDGPLVPCCTRIAHQALAKGFKYVSANPFELKG